jgi:hypothetical protein
MNLKKKSILFVISMLILLLLTNTVLAVSTMTVENVAVASCTNTSMFFNFNISGSLDGVDELHLREFVNGIFVRDFFQQAGGSFNSSSYFFGGTYNVTPPYNFTSHLDIDSGGETIVRWERTGTCDGNGTGTVTSVRQTLPSTPSVPPDNRINWQYGDSNVGILYPGYEGGLDLYLYATDNYISNFITPADVAPYEGNAPAQNTLISSAGSVSVYILTGGEIQVNFGPDAEGKVWVLIMKDLGDRENEGSYYLDPHE